MAPLAYLLGLFTLLGLPRPVGTVTVTDSSSVYAYGYFSRRSNAVNVDTAPRLALGYGWRRSSLTLGYMPRVTAIGLAGVAPSSHTISQGMDGTVTVTRRRVSLSLTEMFVFGTQYLANLNQLAIAPPVLQNPVPQDSNQQQEAAQQSASLGATLPAASPQQVLLPPTDRLRVRSNQTAGSLTYLWSQHWSTRLDGSYVIAGGYGKKAEQVMPRTWTSSAGVSLNYALSLENQLGWQLTGMQSTSSAGLHSWIGLAQQTLATNWNARTTANLAAGVSVRRTTDPTDKITIVLMPVGSASLAHVINESRTATLQASLFAQPLMNQLTGTYAFGTTGNLQLFLQRERAFGSVGATTFQTYYGPTATRSVGGSVRGGYSLTTWLDLAAELRAFRQQTPNPALAQPFQWVSMLTLRLYTPAYRYMP